MAARTTHYGLVKPAENELYNVGDQNGNMDIIDEELFKRGKTFNGIGPDENGNYEVDEIKFARQLVAEDAQQSSAEYLFRTTGGEASLTDGPAKLVSIFGRRTHTGVTPESLDMTVNAVPRSESEEPIMATIDRDTFVAYVQSSGTITLTYTNAWSANPSLYGVTVTGDPVSGDQIVIVYVKENRGLITNSFPEKFISTGWNLYQHTNQYSGFSGYARVKKYSSQYGFLIGGSYSSLKFSETIDGAKTTISPASGYFTIPSDGYIWLTGGDSTTTYILMTWSNWGEGYEGDWQAYTEDVIDLSDLFIGESDVPFPYGLLQVGGVADEINFGIGKAISRIERWTYTAQHVQDAEATGREWEADTDYIYIVRASEVSYSISETGDYDAYDHGEEIIEGGEVPVYVQTLYGQNLVDKLRTDVLTKSQDLVNNLTTNDSTKALSAAQGYALNNRITNYSTDSGTGWVLYRYLNLRILQASDLEIPASGIADIITNIDAPHEQINAGAYYSDGQLNACALIVTANGRIYCGANGGVISGKVRGIAIWVV